MPEKPKCAIDGCEKPSRSRGWCEMHYTRWRTHGDPNKLLRGGADSCSIAECSGPVKAHGWCGTHYRRWLTHGDPNKVIKPIAKERGECAVNGCQEIERARGICNSHYRMWRAGNLDCAADLNLPVVEGRACSIDGCEKGVLSRGWCANHYDKWNRYGDPLASGVAIRSAAIEASRGACVVDDCGRGANYSGWCEGHLARVKRHGHPMVDVPLRPRVRAKVVNGQIRCTKCKEYLPASEFTSDASRIDGISSSCRTCCKLASYRYRARVSSATGTASSSQIAARWDYYGGKCWMCGGEAQSIDHVKPIAKGGSNWPSNLRPACHVCNSRKSSKWPFCKDDLRTETSTSSGDCDREVA